MYLSWVAAGAALYFAASRHLESSWRWAEAHMHPFVATILLYYALPPAFVLSPGIVVYLAINKLIPARCPKCRDGAYRHHERGQLASFFQGEFIIYRCRSCGHVQNLGWYESSGG
jgi:hypothetical protein